MNYYEELGVSQEATEQEIRKAHRRLVKLMHPDAQPDQSLKMLAETQMRRLNSIVSTLLDPDQRRSYDEQLLAAAHSSFRQGPSDRHSWRGIPWWLASSVGAVVLTLAVIWLWADHMGNSFGSRSSRATYIAPIENPSLALPPASIQSPDLDRSSHVGASYNEPLINPAPLPSISDQPVAAAAHKPTDTSKVAIAGPPPQSQPKPDSLQKVAETPKPSPALPNAQQAPKSSTPAGTISATGVQKQTPAPDPKQSAAKVTPIPAPRSSDPKILIARDDIPANNSKPAEPNSDKAGGKKIFSLPAGSLVAQVSPAGKNGSALPSPPRLTTPTTRDYNSAALPGSSLPAAIPPPKPSTPPVAASVGAVSGAGAIINPRDPLEGEWVYAPKEPERHRAGFYPPEFIDLKLFNSGDPGNLKGQYSAKYVVTDRPVSPEISFELASIAKGSRKFIWQSNTGAKGTLNIDAIDEHTIRVDWRTTSAVHGPSLTSGTATLVRRQ